MLESLLQQNTSTHTYSVQLHSITQPLMIGGSSLRLPIISVTSFVMPAPSCAAPSSANAAPLLQQATPAPTPPGGSSLRPHIVSVSSLAVSAPSGAAPFEFQRCSATSTSDTSAYASRRLFTATLNRQCHILCDVCTLVCRTLECQRCSATSTRSNTIIIYAPGGSSLLSQTRQWDFVS
jgi:hypothetical protein